MLISGKGAPLKGGGWGLCLDVCLSIRHPTVTQSVGSHRSSSRSRPLSWLRAAFPFTPHQLSLLVPLDCISRVTAADRTASRLPLLNDWFHSVSQLCPKVPCVNCLPVRLCDPSQVHTVELPPPDGQLGIRPDCRDELARVYAIRCRSCAEQLRGLILSTGLPFRALPSLRDDRG